MPSAKPGSSCSPASAPPQRPEAVATLTRAAHLAWTSRGPDERPVPVRCDWAEFVTLAVAGAAANIGSTEEALAGRPGSWEASCVRDLLSATVGPDDHDLYRHRTEPLVVDIDVDAILTEQGAWRPYRDAQDELLRRMDEARADVVGRPGADPRTVDLELHRIDDEFCDRNDRLAQLRQRDWAAYGYAVEATVRAAAAALPGLAVPVLVNVHLDAKRGSPSQSERWTLADELLTHAIASTPLPGTDQPPPLDRLNAAVGGQSPALPPKNAAQPSQRAALLVVGGSQLCPATPQPLGWSGDRRDRPFAQSGPRRPLRRTRNPAAAPAARHVRAGPPARSGHGRTGPPGTVRHDAPVPAGAGCCFSRDGRRAGPAVAARAGGAGTRVAVHLAGPSAPASLRGPAAHRAGQPDPLPVSVSAPTAGALPDLAWAHTWLLRTGHEMTMSDASALERAQGRCAAIVGRSSRCIRPAGHPHGHIGVHLTAAPDPKAG